jgi:hypothetical protein
VETAMLLLANAKIDSAYTATIALDSTYDTVTKIWTGKFTVTNKTEATNTVTDTTNRTITIVITATLEIIPGSDISNIEIPAGTIDPKIQFTASENEAQTDNEITIDDSENTGTTVVFPTGTTIIGPEGWDGTVQLPKVSSANLNISGYTTSIESVIEIGLSGSSLTFDKPVKIILPNKANKRVGFMVGDVFTEITVNCSNSDLPAGVNECKANDGADLFILTKHFTKFLAYTQTAISVSGGGGGSYSYDSIAPLISNIKTVAGIDSAVITWNTNESSLSYLVYDNSINYGKENKNTIYSTSHTVTLINLLPATTYHYQIKSKDASGNSGNDTDRTFTTLALKKETIEEVKDDKVVPINNVVESIRSFLSISPANLTKSVGNTFNATVSINPQNNRVCAVEGILSFNNLTCQSITLANGVIAQTNPTCSNPYYLIGIPGCTSANKTLLTATVKAKTAGIASLNNTNVDLIGEGLSLGSASIDSNYTINNISNTIVPDQSPIEIIEPEPEALEPIKTPTEPNTPIDTINPEQASLISTNSNLMNYLWIGLIIVIGLGVAVLLRRRGDKS